MLEDFRLKVFMAVAETGSFTKASRKLGVSQPAVSQNISSLEKETGAILFQRARGEVSLTSEGLVFKEYASRIQYWYSATSEMFGQKGKLTSGKPVRICADSVAAAYLLPKPLSMITGSNPDIVFDLTQPGQGSRYWRLPTARRFRERISERLRMPMWKSQHRQVRKPLTSRGKASS